MSFETSVCVVVLLSSDPTRNRKKMRRWACGRRGDGGNQRGRCHGSCASPWLGQRRGTGSGWDELGGIMELLLGSVGHDMFPMSDGGCNSSGLAAIALWAGGCRD